MFILKSNFKPTGDQPQAIDQLVKGLKQNRKNQVLLGVTGSGKTFTIANVIQKLQLPTLIISHNKTLAGQLYQEMRDFFPDNAVSYFVSYYDYYQPEAYMPATDTYIEKEAEVNEMIDKLRLKATTNIITRDDVIVVSSVSCIYNIGSAQEYRNFTMQISVGAPADWHTLAKRLIELMYSRSEFDFKRGSFRIRGNYMDIYPAYEETGLRISQKNGLIDSIELFEPLSGVTVASEIIKSTVIYPAKHYLADPEVVKSVEPQIRADLKKEYEELKAKSKIVEAERLLRRVSYDLEMIKEVGYVNGIENYSRYFDKRKPGEKPYSLLDFFKFKYGDNFLVVIDESHMTVSQIRGMYNGDYARKKVLTDFGFRLKSAFDNRPLKFEEFYNIPSKFIYVSATPAEWEVELSKQEAMQRTDPYNGVTEQLVRPTGITDPEIEIRPAKDEIPDLIKELERRAEKKQKTLVTTLTKKNAEELASYLKDKNVRAEYLHSDIITLERSTILENLRKGDYDVLIGVNLLREGLDLPEVFLVAILDADKEGFLRSRTSLIQTMGRAARNTSGSVILYADTITNSMKLAIDEINRRRIYQKEYNIKHNITPVTIYKPIREKIVEATETDILNDKRLIAYDESIVAEIDPDSYTAIDKKKLIKKLEREMKTQAEQMNFELAIAIRDKIKEIKS